MRRAVALIAISTAFGGCAWVERASMPSGHPVTPGLEANSSSARPALADGGRFVAFESLASNLVASDTNNAADVFVRDLALDVTERVSLTNDDLQVANGGTAPAISDDGRLVLFLTAAQLSAADTDSQTDIYVRDRSLGTTTLRSDSFTALPPPYPAALAEYPVTQPTISGDGSTIAFNVTIAFQGVNVTIGPFVTASGPASLTPHGRLFPNRPSLSDDGSRIAWTSYDVIGTDAEMQSIIVDTNTNALVAFVDGGFVTHQSQGGFAVELSGDGGFAVTSRTAVGHGEVLRYDVAADELTSVVTNVDFLRHISISDDGARVGFIGIRDGVHALWLVEPGTATPPRPLSTDPLGSSATSVNEGVLSGNGEWGAFTTIDPSIAPFDDNPFADVFVRSVDVTLEGPS